MPRVMAASGLPAIATLAMLAWSSTGCGGKAEPSQRTKSQPTPGSATPTPSAPARVTPSSAPRDGFAAVAAAAAGMTYTPPAGFTPTAIRANRDVAYDHAVVSADGRIELRYALRPYPANLPPAMHTRVFSSTFFLTAILNLTRGGSSGEALAPVDLPATDFAADLATMTAVRWFAADGPTDAFGTGFIAGAVMFLHHDQVGDAYLFVMFKDRDATAQMTEDAYHSLVFGPP